MKRVDLRDIKLFLLDMDGTICLGDEPFDGAIEAVKRLNEVGICYLTNNSSKATTDYVKKLTRIGFPAESDYVYSSADAAVVYLKERFGETPRVYCVGTPAFEECLERGGITLTDENPDAVVLGFDLTLTYDKLYKLCILIKGGIPYIVTHMDVNCPALPVDLPDVGAITRCIYASTGLEPEFVCGKPSAFLAKCICEKFSLKPSEIAMVGDRLETDIRFGVDNGMTSILVMTGATTPEILASSAVKPHYVFGNITELSEALDR